MRNTNTLSLRYQQHTGMVPTQEDMERVCSYVYARQMLESWKTKDWAELLREGIGPFDLETYLEEQLDFCGDWDEVWDLIVNYSGLSPAQSQETGQ